MDRIRHNEPPWSTVISGNSFSQGSQWNYLGASIAPVIEERSYGPFRGSVNEIIDTARGWGQDNFCAHLREEVHIGSNPNPVTMSRITGTPGMIFTGELNTLGISHYVDLLNVGVGNHDDATELSKWSVPDYSAEAVDAMWPGVEEELSVLNSIYELKDFKSLPRLLDNTSKTLAKFPGASLFMERWLKGRRLRRATPKLTLKEIVAATTGNYLNYMFAVAPLVSDLKAVHKALRNTRKSVEDLLAREGQPQRRHFKKTLQPDTIGVDGVVNEANAPWSGAKWYWYQRTAEFVGPIEYRASMSYTYRVPGLLKEHALLLGYLDAFGINFNPSIIWNAIPYSFVIDWFAKVGKTVNSLRGKLLAPIVDIEAFDHSIKYTTRSALWQESYRDLKTDPNVSVLSGKVLSRWKDRKVYVRRPCIPSFVVPIRKSRMTTTVITLAGALLGSLWSGGHAPNVHTPSGR